MGVIFIYIDILLSLQNKKSQDLLTRTYEYLDTQINWIFLQGANTCIC